MDTPVAIESLGPTEGSPDGSPYTDNQWTAWAIRKRLPSELRHKVCLRWPGEVEELTGINDAVLKQHRSNGDHPRLYAIGRTLVTTVTDVEDWIKRHSLAPGELVRPATIARGTKLAPRGRSLA